VEKFAAGGVRGMDYGEPRSDLLSRGPEGSRAVQDRFFNKRILANAWRLMLHVGERNRLDLFIRWAAGPAIGGVKPASLVRLPRNGMDRAWDTWGEEICRGLGVSAAILRESSAGVLVLLYRRRLLRRVLKGPSGRHLLSLLYPVESGPDSCLEYLAGRFSAWAGGSLPAEDVCHTASSRDSTNPVQFPHEVGIFLGYPLEDVIAFCAGKANPCNCQGYWKVYHRPEKAKRTFAYMDRARLKTVGEFFPA
jgi:hypothetical protein